MSQGKLIHVITSVLQKYNTMSSFNQWFSTRVTAPQGTSGNVWRYFRLLQLGGAIGIWCIEEMLLHTPYCTGHAPTTKNDLTQNINTTKVGKHHGKGIRTGDFSKKY